MLVERYQGIQMGKISWLVMTKEDLATNSKE